MKVLGYSIECDRIELPGKVKDNIKRYLQILDECYGKNRNINNDLGGYAIIAESLNDIQEICKNIIKRVVPENIDEIICGDGQVYCSSLFILSSDYAVIVIATKELTDILLEGLEE